MKEARQRTAAFSAYSEQRQGRANQGKQPCECRYQACLFKGGHDASPNRLRTWGKLKMAILYRAVCCPAFPQKYFGDGAQGGIAAPARATPMLRRGLVEG